MKKKDEWQNDSQGSPLCEQPTGAFWAAEFSRREFLRAGLTLVAIGAAMPPWLAQLAHADTQRKLKGQKPLNDHILVVLQLTGGNDGLNTVVPYADGRYYDLRPQLAIPDSGVLRLDEKVGLHPALTGLQELFQKGQVAIVQGVGYPNPNRSHFRSMEIWQTADPDGYQRYGWLGKYLDSITDAAPNPILAVSLSRERPQAMLAARAPVPCFASLSELQNLTNDPDLEMTVRAMTDEVGTRESAATVIDQSTRTALDAVEKLREAVKRYQSDVTYANDPFSQGLKQAAQLIMTSPQTRVIYVSVNGFDTHAGQLRAHENLLRGFGNSIKAFQEDLMKMGKQDRVLTMVFSEFGRRVRENGSLGTDHGAAAPMFLVGNRVKGGFYGDHPSLSSLDQGDLRMQTDFRSVYATVLDWLGSDPEEVLGKRFAPVNVFG
ncbi:MAG: DUF1501 domain-containing protein [Fimbriimonadia bacterium]|nr:DUF1501 domain-containing protein [Fimbriimonadia bacterium]